MASIFTHLQELFFVLWQPNDGWCRDDSFSSSSVDCSTVMYKYFLLLHRKVMLSFLQQVVGYSLFLTFHFVRFSLHFLLHLPNFNVRCNFQTLGGFMTNLLQLSMIYLITTEVKSKIKAQYFLYTNFNYIQFVISFTNVITNLENVYTSLAEE